MGVMTANNSLGLQIELTISGKVICSETPLSIHHVDLTRPRRPIHLLVHHDHRLHEGLNL